MHVLTVMLHFSNTVDFLYIKYLEIFYHIRTYSRLWMTIVSLLCIFVQYIEVNVWRECELVETLFLFKTGFLELLGEYRLSGQIGIQGFECLNIMFCVYFIPCLPWVGISDIFSTTGNLNVNAVNHNNFSWTDQWHSDTLNMYLWGIHFKVSLFYEVFLWFSAVQVNAGIPF